MSALQPWAIDYWGLPYKDGGRDRDGVDCWGLFRLIFREQAGIELASFSGEYVTAEDRFEATRLMDLNRGPEWVEICKKDLRPLDALLLPQVGILCHVGICAGGTNFVHCEVGVDTVINDWTALEWERRFERAEAYRHEALCDAR